VSQIQSPMTSSCRPKSLILSHFYALYPLYPSHQLILHCQQLIFGDFGFVQLSKCLDIGVDEL
jgi:hypothetical protein